MIDIFTKKCEKHLTVHFQYFTFYYIYVEITAWLASAYDFYARVVKDFAKPTSECSERASLAILHIKCIIKIVQTSQPCSNLFMSNIERLF